MIDIKGFCIALKCFLIVVNRFGAEQKPGCSLWVYNRPYGAGQNKYESFNRAFQMLGEKVPAERRWL
jgi:hypothetical protein